MNEFLIHLPKIELHAHLNGSLRISTILEISNLIFSGTEKQLEFRRKALDVTKFDGLQEIFEKFKLVHELTATKAGLELATLFAIRDFEDDNTVYLELRTSPKCNEFMTKTEYLKIVLTAIRTASELYERTLVKLLPSIDRSQSVDSAKETLEAVLAIREKFPDIIVGIDFSGNPSCGEFKSFIPVLTQARANGLKLALHCAEISNELEAEDMLQFGMDRCGHGTFLSDEHFQKLAVQGIPVECCLSSNLKCGTISSYAAHHFGRLRKINNAIAVICTDDCGIFKTSMSEELCCAVNTFKLNKKDIYALCMNSAKYCFADETVKLQLTETVTKYFDENDSD